MINSIAHVLTGPGGIRSRRGFLAQLAAGTAAGVATLSWRDMLIAKAEEVRKQGKSMILLWMDGGPSQFDTFNPKIGSQFQGPAKAIPTNVAGVEFAEYWPQTAQVMAKIALIRSIGEHRGYQCATGRAGASPGSVIRREAGRS